MRQFGRYELIPLKNCPIMPALASYRFNLFWTLKVRSPLYLATGTGGLSLAGFWRIRAVVASVSWS